MSPRHRSSLVTRGATLAAALVLALTATPADRAHAAAAATPPEAAEAAAHWSTTRLTDGVRVFDEEYAFDDTGLTIDVLLALAATGTGGQTITAVADWVATQVGSYTGVSDGATYVGPTAKAIVAAIAAGRDPRAFGDVDLVALLEGREAADGRFTDDSSFGDYSSTISQALAIIALERAGVGASSAAVDRLAAQACEDGGLPLEFDADACVSDVDATAFAIDALVLHGGAVETSAAAVNWLEDVQAADGSFATREGVANTNSTALAAMALRRGGSPLAADLAVEWILARVQGCDAEAPGAVLADPTGTGDTLRATTQAVLGLTGVGPSTVDADGAAPETRPLDCTADAGAPDDGTDVAAPTVDAAAASDDTEDRPTPVIVGVGVALALAVLVGLTVRRRRDAR
jgi:MYXO-CTERM domain-containing protein